MSPQRKDYSKLQWGQFLAPGQVSVIGVWGQLYLVPLRFLVMEDPLVSTAHPLPASILIADQLLPNKLYQEKREEGRRRYMKERKAGMRKGGEERKSGGCGGRRKRGK